MRKSFPGYFRPNDHEFSELWENCVFVLDANVLLNLYRYTPETSEELIEILGALSDRLWIPHQAAKEYLRNRLEVIREQRKAYNEIASLLDNSQNKLDGVLSSFRRHPYIRVNKVLSQVNSLFSTIKEDLRNYQNTHPDLFQEDDLQSKLMPLLDGKVGPPFSSDRLEKVYEEGRLRYDQEVPPGYKDAAKDSPAERYGDLIIWLQMIDKATELDIPFVLVTDDTKEDWWWRLSDAKIVGPRPELIEEFQHKAGVRFYMYQTDQFMWHAKSYLRQQVDQMALDEILHVRQYREAIEMHDSLRESLIDVQSTVRSFNLLLHEIQDEESELSDQIEKLTRFHIHAGSRSELSSEESQLLSENMRKLQLLKRKQYRLQITQEELETDLRMVVKERKLIQNRLQDIEHQVLTKETAPHEASSIHTS